LPRARIIGAEVEVPDIEWIWEVFGAVISFGDKAEINYILAGTISDRSHAK
jgi:hypothetical protein